MLCWENRQLNVQYAYGRPCLSFRLVDLWRNCFREEHLRNIRGARTQLQRPNIQLSCIQLYSYIATFMHNKMIYEICKLLICTAAMWIACVCVVQDISYFCECVLLSRRRWKRARRFSASLQSSLETFPLQICSSAKKSYRRCARTRLGGMSKSDLQAAQAKPLQNQSNINVRFYLVRSS